MFLEVRGMPFPMRGESAVVSDGEVILVCRGMWTYICGNLSQSWPKLAGSTRIAIRPGAKLTGKAPAAAKVSKNRARLFR